MAQAASRRPVNVDVWRSASGFCNVAGHVLWIKLILSENLSFLVLSDPLSLLLVFTDMWGPRWPSG